MRPGCGPFRAGLPPGGSRPAADGQRSAGGEPSDCFVFRLASGAPHGVLADAFHPPVRRRRRGARLGVGGCRLGAGCPHADRSAPPPSGQGPAGPRIRPGRPTLRKGQASRTPPASPNDPGDRPSRRGRGEGSVRVVARGGDNMVGGGLGLMGYWLLIATEPFQ